MPPKKKKKKKDGGEHTCGEAVAAGVSPQELQQLSALLELLRAGSPALTKLLGSQTAKEDRRPEVPVQPMPAPKAPSQDAPSKGWVTVARKNCPTKAASSQVNVLQQEGFSVPVCMDVTELRNDTPGVCLATKEQVLSALEERRPSVAQAVLCPVRATETAEELWVTVVDQDGKEKVWRRFMTQLGPTPVQFECKAPKGKSVKTGLKLIVMSVSESHSGKMWEEVRKQPKAVLGQWLKETAKVAPPFEMRGPRIIGGNSLECVVEIDEKEWEKTLRASGQGAVQTREWFEKQSNGIPADRQFERVPLPLKQDLASALRTAEGMGSTAWGVLACGKGWAVRVKAEHYGSALESVQPEQERAKFDGKRWEITKLPLSWWKKEHINEFLGKIWSVTPIYSIRQGMTRTWVVVAKSDPIATKVQHDFGLAHIRPKLPSPTTKEVKIWKPPKKSGPLQQQPTSANSRSPEQNVSATGAWKQEAADHRQQVKGAAAAGLPDSLLEQMRIMIHTAIAPLQQQAVNLNREIIAIRNVMEGNEEEQEAGLGQPGHNCVEEAKDSSMADSKKRSTVPEPAGMPPHKKVVSSHRGA